VQTVLSWFKNMHRQKLSENRTVRSRLCGFCLCSFAHSRHFGGEEEKGKKTCESFEERGKNRERGLERQKKSRLFLKYKLEMKDCLPVLLHRHRLVCVPGCVLQAGFAKARLGGIAEIFGYLNV